MSPETNAPPELCAPPCTWYCGLVHLTRGRVLAVNALLVALAFAAAWLLLVLVGASGIGAVYLVCVVWIPTATQQAARWLRRQIT